MVNFSPLAAEIVSLVGTPQQISTGFASCFVTAATSLNGSQPNFAQCLAVSCVATLYIHFWRLLPRNGILPGENSVCILQVLRSPIGSNTAWHSSIEREPNFAALSTGRHLYSAEWPSRWALAHILVQSKLHKNRSIYQVPQTSSKFNHQLAQIWLQRRNSCKVVLNSYHRSWEIKNFPKYVALLHY